MIFMCVSKLASEQMNSFVRNRLEPDKIEDHQVALFRD